MAGQFQYRFAEKNTLSRHIVAFHDGMKKNKDGSRFYDVRLFPTVEDANQFIKELKRKGFKQDKMDKIIQYPGVAITSLWGTNYCILNTKEHTNVRISRDDAAKILRGVRKGIQAYYNNLEVTL